MRTDEELKQLAKDFVGGKIFTSNMVDTPSMMSMVFMPLVFLDGTSLEEFKVNPPHMLYEYLERAGPRSVNGMPIFMSFGKLSKEECEKINMYVTKINECMA